MGQRVITIPLPVAGADFTLKATVPMVVKYVTGVLTTSATVASRSVSLYYYDADNNVLCVVGVDGTQAASNSFRYGWSVNARPWYIAGGASTVGVLPDVVMDQRWALKSSTFGIQAGDQWSELFAVAWIDDL